MACLRNVTVFPTDLSSIKKIISKDQLGSLLSVITGSYLGCMQFFKFNEE